MIISATKDTNLEAIYSRIRAAREKKILKILEKKTEALDALFGKSEFPKDALEIQQGMRDE